MVRIARLAVLGVALALVLVVVTAAPIPDGRRWHGSQQAGVSGGPTAWIGVPGVGGRRWT